MAISGFSTSDINKTNNIKDLTNNFNSPPETLDLSDDFFKEDTLDLEELSTEEQVNGNIISSLTEEEIQNMIGRMDEEQYNQFVKGIEEYYDKQANYLESLLRDENNEGYEDILNKVSTYIQRVEHDRILDSSDPNALDGLEKYGVTDYPQALKFQKEMQEIVDNTKESVKMSKNLRDSAKYDYLSYLEDYYNYSSDIKISDVGDLNKYKQIVQQDNPSAAVVSLQINFSYTEAKKDNPDLSPLEFIKKIQEEYPNTDFTCDGINDVEQLKKLARASKYEPEMAKKFNYLYNQDPEKAAQYLKDIKYELNNIEGQIEAEDFLEKLREAGDDEDKLDEIVYNELGVHLEGLYDGLDSFIMGAYHTGEAGYTGIQKIGQKLGVYDGEIYENRVMDVSEYKKMYILQALLSKSQKEQLGLLNEDGTSTNNIIDFSKEYTGKFLKNNYEISQGIGNMLPSIVLSTINPAVGSAALGISAGGNAYHEAMVEGSNYISALMYGIYSGSSEAITERMLGGLPPLSDVQVTGLKTYLQSMGKEGSQEIIQGIMEDVYQWTLMGKELPETAEEWKEWRKEKLKEGAYGVITAGYLNIPSLTINTISSQQIKSKVSQTPTEEASVKIPSISEVIDDRKITKYSPKEFEALSTKEQLRIIQNENILKLTDILDAEMSEETRNALNKRIKKSIDIFATEYYLNPYFVSRNKRPFKEYIFNNMLDELSNNQIFMLLKDEDIDNQGLKEVLTKRIEAGEIIGDIPTQEVSNFGNKTNIFDRNLTTLVKIVGQDCYQKYITNIKDALATIPDNIKQKGFGQVNHLLLITDLYKNGKFDENSLNLLNSLFDKHSKIGSTFDFRLLDSDIINDFGTQFIEEVGNYNDLSIKILSLKENNTELYNLYVNMVQINSQDNSLDIFYSTNKMLLNYLFENQEVLSNINIENVNVDSLINYILYKNTVDTSFALDYSNNFTEELYKLCDNKFKTLLEENIELSKELEEIQNEEDSINKTLKIDDIKSNIDENLNQLKDIYLNKYFSMDLKQLDDFMLTYGNYDQLSPDTNAKDYIKIKDTIEILKQLQETESIIDLEKLYNNQSYTFNPEEILALKDMIKQNINKIYEEQFERTKEAIDIKLKNAEVVNYNGKEIPIVELNDDFSMLVHSNFSGFVDQEKSFNSYVDEWLKNYDPKGHGLSTSYINNNYLGSAPVVGNGVLYGFYDVKANDIYEMAPYDLDSNIANYGFTSGNKQIYLSPDEMVNSSSRLYNEFVLSRDNAIPSCVILYEDATVDNIESAYKAASEWDIPVVKINRSEIATKQMASIQGLLDDFNSSKEFAKLEEAIQLYENATSGLQLNKVGDTGIVESLSSEKNTNYIDIYDSSSIKSTLDSIVEAPSIPEKQKALEVLENIKKQYDITSKYGSDKIPETKSMLDIDGYISKLKGEINNE